MSKALSLLKQIESFDTNEAIWTMDVENFLSQARDLIVKADKILNSKGDKSDANVKDILNMVKEAVALIDRTKDALRDVK